MRKITRKITSISAGQKRFLEAPLVRQADGELKKIIYPVIVLNKPWILQGYHTYYLVFLFFCRYNIVRTILLFLFLSTTRATRLRMKVVLSKNLTHLAMDDKQVGNRRVHPSGFEYSKKALIFYPRKFRNLLKLGFFIK